MRTGSGHIDSKKWWGVSGDACSFYRRWRWISWRPRMKKKRTTEEEKENMALSFPSIKFDDAFFPSLFIWRFDVILFSKFSSGCGKHFRLSPTGLHNPHHYRVFTTSGVGFLTFKLESFSSRLHLDNGRGRIYRYKFISMSQILSDTEWLDQFDNGHNRC